MIGPIRQDKPQSPDMINTWQTLDITYSSDALCYAISYVYYVQGLSCLAFVCLGSAIAHKDTNTQTNFHTTLMGNKC